MAVTGQGEALRAVRTLIGRSQVPAESILRRPYLPDGLQPSADPARMGPDTLIGGYGDPARYVLGADDAIRADIARPPAQVLSGRPTIKSETVAAYLKASIDLTMQGGTTSGVVYPLAVCELASEFRFRNVGGASAGAIAAAFTAAAELGRSGALLDDPETAEPGTTTQASLRDGVAEASLRDGAAEASLRDGAAQASLRDGAAEASLRDGAAEASLREGVAEPALRDGNSDASPRGAVTGPSLRRGFAGLADVIGWLTQTGPEDPEDPHAPGNPDEFRLAQLFRPGRATAPVFRAVIALMRGQGWSLPLVGLVALGRAAVVTAAAVFVVAVAATGLLESRLSGVERAWYVVPAIGALGLLAFTATVLGVLLTVQGLRGVLARSSGAARLAPRLVQRLRRYTSSYAVPASSFRFQLPLGLLLLAVVVVYAFVSPMLYLAAVLVGVTASVLLIGIALRILLRFVGRLRDRRYGLLAGTTPQPERRGPLDRAAGVPKSTVQPSLVPWLADCLNDLAGLPRGRVLRFGHLWAGPEYDRMRTDPAELPRLQDLSDRVDERLINLQLMTTDLTRHRPFCFPLPRWDGDDPDQLWICVEKLVDGESALFPPEILNALRTPHPRQVTDPETGGTITLHRLPQPWDLPVLFAVRISMALPVLFQAVRLYRIAAPPPITDDFGRGLVSAGSSPDDEPADTVQELWFSDGGITSNFPVHFFDSALPRWPTVSLNLGPHAEEAPHLDVWLPQDWDDLRAPTTGLTRSGLSFGGAIFGTTLSWRDSLQSALPGYRNRIAQVRTSPNEGGTNLFMPREIIASLALRGALAGARLRTRFSEPTHWNRFRWLRLRTAIANIEQLRVLTQARRGVYADAFEGPEWLDTQVKTFVDTPEAGGLDWYRPNPGYWPLAPRMLTTFADAHRPDPDPQIRNPLTAGAPRPRPVLRQVSDE